jgi:uncharacterized protein (DUF2147 family)
MRKTLVAAAAACVIGGAAQAGDSGGLVGTWLTENGDSKIRISACGSVYCGTVVWAKSNDLDRNNPDPKLRKRAIVGMPLTKDMRPDGSDRWAGSIYNPQNGKTYEISMQMKGRDAIEVEGCVLGILCGSEAWARQNQETASMAPN